MMFFQNLSDKFGAWSVWFFAGIVMLTVAPALSQTTRPTTPTPAFTAPQITYPTVPTPPIPPSKLMYNSTKAKKASKLSLVGWYNMARSFMGMVQKEPINLDELAKIQNGSLAPLNGPRGGSMVILMAVGGIYVLTTIGLLIYFLMLLGVLEPSPIRYYPRGGKALRILLTVGTVLFTGGLMAGSALMIVSSMEYSTSLVTTGPIVDVAFSDFRNYVFNTMEQIWNDQSGMAAGAFDQVQTALLSEMSAGGTIISKSVNKSSALTQLTEYSTLMSALTRPTTGFSEAYATALSALQDLNTKANSMYNTYLVEMQKQAVIQGGFMDTIIKESKCSESICKALSGSKSLSSGFVGIENLDFTTLNNAYTKQLGKLKTAITSLQPVPAFTTAISDSIFGTANFKELVGFRILTYRTVILKADLNRIRKDLLEPMSKRIEAWYPMTQKLLDPSVSSNVSAAVGIYAFIFSVICILSFAGTGIGYVYYKPEVRPHRRKKNQVFGGTLLMLALYATLVFSWGAMIATSYLMVYASQLDGALCAALTGEPKNFTKLRTGIRALELNGTGAMSPIQVDNKVSAIPVNPNNTLDWATIITNCKLNPSAHTGINMQNFWNATDVQKHFDTFNFNLTFSNMTGELITFNLQDVSTNTANKALITAGTTTTSLDTYKQFLGNWSFSISLGDFKTSTATSYKDFATTAQTVPTNDVFFTEYSKMQKLAAPACSAYMGSSDILDKIAPATLALDLKNKDPKNGPSFSSFKDLTSVAVDKLIEKLGLLKTAADAAVTAADSLQRKVNPNTPPLPVAAPGPGGSSAGSGSPSPPPVISTVKIEPAVYSDYGKALNAILADFIGRELIPSLRDKIGACKPVYDAFSTMADAFCTSTIPPLMGVWFGAGLCIFSCAFMVPFIYYLSHFYTQGKTARDGKGRPSMLSIARKSIMSSISSISRKSSGGSNRRSSSRKSRKSSAAPEINKTPARPSVPPTISRPATPSIGLPPLTTPNALPTLNSSVRPSSATATNPRSSQPMVSAKPASISTPTSSTRPVVRGSRGASRPSPAALATAAGASRPSILARPPAR